jgi:hypothetical protein
MNIGERGCARGGISVLVLLAALPGVSLCARLGLHPGRWHAAAGDSGHDRQRRRQPDRSARRGRSRHRCRPRSGAPGRHRGEDGDPSMMVDNLGCPALPRRKGARPMPVARTDDDVSLSHRDQGSGARNPVFMHGCAGSTSRRPSSSWTRMADVAAEAQKLAIGLLPEDAAALRTGEGRRLAPHVRRLALLAPGIGIARSCIRTRRPRSCLHSRSSNGASPSAGTTWSTGTCASALAGMLGVRASFGSWTTAMPPASLIARSPDTPSSSAPDSTTPMTPPWRALAAVRNSGSTAGREPFSRGPRSRTSLSSMTRTW